MENSKPLATESFSYSWLVDRKPHSSNKSSQKEQNFEFDVSFTALVHADEIFSDGHIMPLYVETSLKTSTSASPSPTSSYSSGNQLVSSSKKQSFFLIKWKKSSQAILRKCSGLVKPLYQTILCRRKSIRVDDLDRKVCEVGRWTTSPGRSSAVDWYDIKKISSKDEILYGMKRVKSWSCSPPRISQSCSSNVWCGDESSIHEAILYCKRSIEKCGNQPLAEKKEEQCIQ